MRIYTWGVAIAGWAALLPLLLFAPTPLPEPLLGLLALAVVSEWLMVRSRVGAFSRQEWRWLRPRCCSSGPCTPRWS